MLPFLLCTLLQGISPVADPAAQLLAGMKTSPSGIVFVDPGAPATKKVHLVRQWQGPYCRFQVNNAGDEPVRIREVLLFEVEHGLPASTKVHGEGFQMLSQTGGTIGALEDLEQYTDRGHYRLAEPEGFRSLHGALELAPPTGRRLLFGYASCKRFDGRFDLSPTHLRGVIDAEGLAIEPGTSWELEELFFDAGGDPAALEERLAKAIEKHHPRTYTGSAPTGWCSWYAFGANVTAKDVQANVAVMKKELPELDYVQIDDGYQPHMGDWLDTGPAFGGDVKSVIAEITRMKLKPALWLAPFVADADSKLFHAHPDWFVQDAAGKPLRSDTVGFGGWRLGPWYCLDGTHPAVQAHFEQLFGTLREKWGVAYFKLDALYWGAIHGGRFHDPSATRIEAYRRGMEAIRRGAGDAFVLGCNHPMWASLGLMDGARTSMDVERSFAAFARTGRQNLLRRWMDGRLWWNDPDCALLAPGPSEDEVSFHAALLAANGGMILSGDDLAKLPPARLSMLKKLASIPSDAKRTSDARFEHHVIAWKDGELHALLNWGDTPLAIPINFEGTRQLRDAWTGSEIGLARSRYTGAPLPPRSGRLIELRAAPSPSKPDRGAPPRTPPNQ